MKRFYAVAFIIALAIASCKNGNKKSMKGDEKVETTDFIEFFNEVGLPVTIWDSAFKKKPADTSLIDNAIFHQFISDTIFKHDLGKEQPKVYAIGRFSNGEEETYLLFRAVSNSKQAIYVATFNKKNEFSASMPLITSAGSTGSEKMTIDKKYTFTHTDITKGADGSVSPVNTIYAYNNAGLFMVILTDGIPAGTDLPIIDPIDTLPRKGKWAGNYARDKRNLLSIRDATVAGQLRFFIHMEKKEAHCDGELKAEARMIGADSATYTGNGDPCTLGFKFSRNSIRITETNCGSKHGMECTFNGTYTKKREPVSKKQVTATKKG